MNAFYEIRAAISTIYRSKFGEIKQNCSQIFLFYSSRVAKCIVPFIIHFTNME